jgi:hypothetical protein
MRSAIRTARLPISLIALSLLVLALPGVAHGDIGSGTVTGQVTPKGPPGACIVVGATEIDYGELSFNAGKFSPRYIIESCSTVNQDFLIKGTDAEGDGGAQWTLSDHEIGRNQFMVDVYVGGVTWLSHENKKVAGNVLPEWTYSSTDHVLRTPSIGSQGHNQTVTWDMIWTAVPTT